MRGLTVIIVKIRILVCIQDGNNKVHTFVVVVIVFVVVIDFFSYTNDLLQVPFNFHRVYKYFCQQRCIFIKPKEFR